MKVSEAMTKNPQWVSPESTIFDVAKKMKQLDTGFMLVCDQSKPIGLVTDRDIVLKLADGFDVQSTRISDIMQNNICSCFQDDNLETASQMMEKMQIRRLVVLEKGNSNRVVGVISLGDIAKKTHDINLCGEIVEKVSQNRRAA